MSQSKGTLLVVDDDEMVCAGLSALLEEMNWEVRTAGTAKEAYVAFSSFSPDVVILDITLPDASGVDVLQQFKQYSEATPVIMISGGGSVDRVVDCMKQGAETYIQKPFDSETLAATLEQVHRSTAVQRELRALKREPRENAGFIGVSDAARQLNDLVDRVAAAAAPVLIEGESGSGKGLIARLIHQRSPRAQAPFVDLNCAGLSKELLESELFGHEKGAFTGATSTKQGLFEVASGGTLFLDEIGEMEVTIQARLLKALEDRKFRRVGGLRDLHAEFRLIAATNRTLLDEVAQGRFRKDLLYRLNVVTIRVAPLRDRREDIPLLTARVLETLAADMGRKPTKVSERAMRKLSDYPWPGNVRELRNALERAMLVSSGNELRAEDISLEDQASVPQQAGTLPLKHWQVRPLEDITVEYIRSAVAAVDGNMRKAARLLQISPSTLYSKLKQDPPQNREGDV